MRGLPGTNCVGMCFVRSRRLERRHISVRGTRHRHRWSRRCKGDNLPLHFTYPPDQPAFNHRSHQPRTFTLLILSFEIITMFDIVSFFRLPCTFEELFLRGSATLGFGFLQCLGLVEASHHTVGGKECKSSPSLSHP